MLKLFREAARVVRSAVDRMVMCGCRHEFALEDLELTGIPEPVKPTSKDYTDWKNYLDQVDKHIGHTKRVRWPCMHCGKVFFAHCGLDISPRHGKMTRRSKLNTYYRFAKQRSPNDNH